MPRIPENTPWNEKDIWFLVFPDILDSYEHVLATLSEKLKNNASTKVITTLLALTLTLNNFIFNCRNYLQIKGCAMGTICALSYESLWTTSKENSYTHLSRHFHLYTSGL